MADWDTGAPADDDIVSQYPSNERAARSALVTNFGVDHHSTDDADVGKHDQVSLTDAATDPTFASGQRGLWNNGGSLRTRVASGTVNRVVQFASGVKQVFYQASAPTGWTQDTGVNDRVLRVVSGTGGGTGGNWTLSGMSVDGHALTIAEMPSHNHGGGNHSHNWTGDNDAGTGTLPPGGQPNVFTSVATSSSGTIINTQGSDNPHTHGLTNSSWRPSHIDVLVASID